ncbi:peroxisomal sarcosine oxidase isoform X1 [Gadus macrocephalus]|uniref:peroxisomal sarcosine oxidase isoform X1 n=1 Tax=Gadus macrocephalus TaxID=80720 RepID=UPI0028CBBB58|nr:peroxisomal sarcosine oxidase isoform X1 [Gadus macrocephalus]
MSTEGDYDCIVIGAGVQGSFTAYQLAKKKQRTLLLEQFVLPHTRGSSHGQTRIIRKAYDQDYYTVMMEECYRMWAQLEEEASVKLVRQTGLLVMGPENSSQYQAVKNTLQKNRVPMVILPPEEFSKHIPNVNLSEGDGALVDTTAGVLFADRALRAVQGQFLKLGGIIKDGQKVSDIKPGALVTVTASGGVYRAKNLVLTAGSWTNGMLSYIGLQLPLKVLKINVCYWKEKVPGSYNVQQRFPAFLQVECPEGKHHIYGLPSNEYPGLMKHFHGQSGELPHAATRARAGRQATHLVGPGPRRSPFTTSLLFLPGGASTRRPLRLALPPPCRAMPFADLFDTSLKVFGCMSSMEGWIHHSGERDTSLTFTPSSAPSDAIWRVWTFGLSWYMVVASVAHSPSIQ